MHKTTLLLVAAAGVAASCTGDIGVPAGAREDGTPNGNGPVGPNGEPATTDLAAAVSLQRLTSNEYDNTIRDLLYDGTRASSLVLPADVRNPFDNDSGSQIVSSTLLDGVELLARDVAARLIKDTARRDLVVGCKPKGAGDAACLQHFITTFGRRALRRPLGADEVMTYMKLQAVATMDGDFYAAVDAVVRAFLQDPSFLYRVEVGTPVPGKPGVFLLDPWEMATRLSYTLWGTMPSDALLGLAETGALKTAADVRAAAAGMLGDQKARDRIGRFHAMLFGYETVANNSLLTAAMKKESDALVARVVFDGKLPWQDLFRSTETYVTYDLAKHYGLPKLPATLTKGSAKADWVSYDGTKRRGIMSQGGPLSVAGTDDEMKLTILRGKSIRERLFCKEMPPKPNNINTTPPVVSSPCKRDFFNALDGSTCGASCHQFMDPIGLGLDNYDSQGRYRTFDKDAKTQKNLTQCPISGDGELAGIGGAFNGPAGLEDLMLGSGALGECATTQFFRFAFGRNQLDDADRLLAGALARPLGGGDFRFEDLLLDFVSARAFSRRRTD